MKTELSFIISEMLRQRVRNFPMYILVLMCKTMVFAQSTQHLPGSIQPNNLEPLWDEEKVLENPHKGWYLHYFDNSIKEYGPSLAPDDFLEDFPGLNDVYLRLAWSYLEPKEGQFNWQVIDTVINRWVEKGYKISFRISCKETNTDQKFATPEWVKDAGAQGKMIYYERYNSTTWEPEYGDPVFLEKLENFHEAFAIRYDGKPWVEYVDLGSFGDWGEWHTSKGSNKDWPVEVLKKHIDIHTRHYKKTQLVISDDIIGSRFAEDGSKEELRKYLLDKDISWRDDSALLRGWEKYGFSTLRNPELFEGFWQTMPINLEMGHYGRHVKKHGTWKGGRPFERAIEESHATYIGFHGNAREWLADHPEQTTGLVNKVGYWYFPKRLDIRDTLSTAQKHKARIIWINKGVAPAYFKYDLKMRFVKESDKKSYGLDLTESNNKNWMPYILNEENYQFSLPENLSSGHYWIDIQLIEPVHDKNAAPRPIELGLKDTIMRSDKFYRIGKAFIKSN